MKILALSLTTLVVVATVEGSPKPQGGFFQGLRNIFRRPSNRPPPNRPPPPGSFQPQQPQFNQPQQPQFNQPQQPQFNQPQQPQFNQPQQPQFNQPQQPQFNQPPQQPQQSQQFVQRPPPAQQTFSRPPQQQRNPAQTQQRGCTPGSGLNGCPGACANHFDNRQRPYIVTYKINDRTCSNFTGEEAEAYCKLQGGHAVSLDDNEKATYFENLAITDARRYFWTGGRIDHNAGLVTWPSGKSEGYERGKRFWSHTGGKKPIPEAQPDNRDGNEFCIGVLNNFYADGVKWHDVACHHRKPTICEL